MMQMISLRLVAGVLMAAGAAGAAGAMSLKTPGDEAQEPAAEAGTAAIPGAAPDASGSGDEIARNSYTCADGQSLEVVTVNTASGNSYAVIEHDGHLVPMEIAISASGARWLPIDPDTKLELWEHQGTISLNRGEGGEPILEECPANP